MDKVIVTEPFVNIFTMQVCADKDATDEEILSVCNTQTLEGTSNGWSRVIRKADDVPAFYTSMNDARKKALPMQCEDYPDRLYFLVLR